MNSKGCSFIVAVLVAAIGLGIGYYKFRAQQQKALHDERIAQWHGPLLAMLGHPAQVRFRKQFFSVSGYLCGEYALVAKTGESGAAPAGEAPPSDSPPADPVFSRFVVSPDAVALVGAKAYTQSVDGRARRQRQQYQTRFDTLIKKGATARQAFDKVAWAPLCG